MNVHRVAKDKKEAVRMAIMAGIDISMTPNDFEFTKLLIELVKEGTIPESRLDLSVRRILKLKQDLGLFYQTSYDKSYYSLFGSEEHAQASYDVAAECLTLLKNKKNVLPVSKNEKIFVCGPAANSLNLLNGAWTHTWQGIDTTYNTKGKQTILAALQSNSSNISYAKGVAIDSVENIKQCVKQAKQADKIVIAIGETPCTEIPGNINDLTLTAPQLGLINELSTLNKPIILVCNFNRPRIINSVVEKVDAILYAYLSGDEGGRAIADCIYGKVNPSGKLPFTYPRHVNSFVHYDRKFSEDQDVDFSANAYRPQFDFGFGLSYTDFAYSNIKLSDTTLGKTEKITLSVVVKNTGTTTGKEVVQLYYADLVASITPSVKKLMAYEKIKLVPGETKTISFDIRKEDFSFINKKLKRITESGEIELMLHGQKKKIYVE